jgi:hypothetical protein
MPVILATQEVEVGRITFKDTQGKKFGRLHLTNNNNNNIKKMGVILCIIPAIQEV